jgi:hypothetical protein
MVSQAWKTLPQEEREQWEELARRDKARYEMEKTMYTGPWKVPAKKRSQKDPNAPKRPMSAFLSFSNSKRSQVKNAHPNIGNAEVSRILAQMWKDAAEDERKDHIDKEFKLRQMYKVAIAEWRKNSECEMQAARQEREDEAMRAVDAGKTGAEQEYENRGDYQYAVTAYPTHHPSPGSHIQSWEVPSYAASSGHHNGASSYYPHPQHYGHAAYAEPNASAIDAAGPSYPQGPYYDRGAPVYDGYGQPYGQAPTYPPSYGTNHLPPHPENGCHCC